MVYLNKPGLKEKHVAVLQREGTYLRKLQHKNIVRCLKIYQSPHQWVFALEYLKGGMLLNDLAKVRTRLRVSLSRASMRLSRSVSPLTTVMLWR